MGRRNPVAMAGLGSAAVTDEVRGLDPAAWPQVSSV